MQMIIKKNNICSHMLQGMPYFLQYIELVQDISAKNMKKL